MGMAHRTASCLRAAALAGALSALAACTGAADDSRGASPGPVETAPGTAPAIVLLAGCENVNATVADWVEAFRTAGWHVAVVDDAVRGGCRAVTGSDAATAARIDGRVDAAHGALAGLRERADVDPDHIYLMGWSEDGEAAGLAVTPDRRAVHEGAFAGAVAMYPACTAWFDAEPIDRPVLAVGLHSAGWLRVSACPEYVDRRPDATVTLSVLEEIPRSRSLLGGRSSIARSAQPALTYRMTPTVAETRLAMREVGNFLGADLLRGRAADAE